MYMYVRAYVCYVCTHVCTVHTDAKPFIFCNMQGALDYTGEYLKMRQHTMEQPGFKDQANAVQVPVSSPPPPAPCPPSSLCHVCVCVFVHMYACAHTHTCMYARAVSTHSITLSHVHSAPPIPLRAYTHTHTYAHTLHTHYTHITHTHTHTHTHTQESVASSVVKTALDIEAEMLMVLSHTGNFLGCFWVYFFLWFFFVTGSV